MSQTASLTALMMNEVAEGDGVAVSDLSSSSSSCSSPPSSFARVGEALLWLVGGLCYAVLLWLAVSRGEAFDAARNAYLAIGGAGLVLAVLIPLAAPRGGVLPYRLLAAAGFVALGLDQVTKWVAVCFLKGSPSIEIIPNLFSFTYVENSGAAFGLLRGYTTLFIIMAIVTVAIIFVYFRLTGPDERLVQVALIFILAGAVGNVLDRCFLGYVVDFLDLHWYAYKWPVFNVADTVIDIGVGLIVIDVVRDMLRGEEPTAPAAPASEA